MKNLLFLLLFSIPFFSPAQKIQNLKTKETIELKDKVENYCTVVMQPFKGKFDFFVGTDELGVWKFIDENGNQIEFQTIVAIMNYLHKSGWEYINNIGGSDAAAPQYFFRKNN